jgi:DNA replication protein DnaC
MNPIPELSPMLKQLRLSGILESLPVRNREAIAKKLAFTDFLALLIADEVARREHKKFTTRVRRAGFRGEKTLEGFDFSVNPHLDQAYLNDLATYQFIAEKVAVLIAGPCGTGKSHIAQALGHCAVRAGYDVLFTTLSKLLGSLQAGPGPPPASNAAFRPW